MSLARVTVTFMGTLVHSECHEEIRTCMNVDVNNLRSYRTFRHETTDQGNRDKIKLYYDVAFTEWTCTALMCPSIS